jgi:hypothetical protein
MVNLMANRSGERIHYLTLAIDARRAIKALKSYGKNAGRTDNLESALKLAVNSTKALSASQELYSQLHGEGSYDHFEQIQTLQDVIANFDSAALLRKLEGILTSSDKQNEEDIQLAIRFFSAIEDRALYYYNDPMYAEAS